ncbi:hypothetical protein AVEN_180118-1 [Araneus ventricosus]|uniref:Uncharacterized protein n=1 Tax=Araneus ventricosus TaxID=182803 RepID=A0A4Y2VK53_ARAVE|nr:hypothetical protein AVEN_180118-1 [Araneus ventricosus]
MIAQFHLYKHKTNQVKQKRVERGPYVSPHVREGEPQWEDDGRHENVRDLLFGLFRPRDVQWFVHFDLLRLGLESGEVRRDISLKKITLSHFIVQKYGIK